MISLFNKDWSLAHAARKGDVATIEVLLSKGTSANARSVLRRTALCLAAGARKREAVRVLLERGADPNMTSPGGKTPLQLAVCADDQQIVSLLLSKGANVSLGDNTGATALHLAAGRGLVEMSKILVTHGADLSAKNRAGQTPLDLALDAGHRQVIQVLHPIGRDEQIRRVREEILPQVKVLLDAYYSTLLGLQAKLQHGDEDDDVSREMMSHLGTAILKRAPVFNDLLQKAKLLLPHSERIWRIKPMGAFTVGSLQYLQEVLDRHSREGRDLVEFMAALNEEIAEKTVNPKKVEGDAP